MTHHEVQGIRFSVSGAGKRGAHRNQKLSGEYRIARIEELPYQVLFECFHREEMTSCVQEDPPELESRVVVDESFVNEVLKRPANDLSYLSQCDSAPVYQGQ